MNPRKHIYDISVLLGSESVTYPGDPSFQKEMVYTIEAEGSDVSRLDMSAHAGTHLDAPRHFFPDGASIDLLLPERFILPARVIEIDNADAIYRKDLHAVPFIPGEALLFKTENSRTGRCCSGIFTQEFVYLTLEAARLCIDRQVPLVGIDYISIEKFGDETYPVHRALLQNEVLILESLNLAEVPPGRYELICLPLKIRNGEASPVRAVLITGGM